MDIISNLPTGRFILFCFKLPSCFVSYVPCFVWLVNCIFCILCIACFLSYFISRVSGLMLLRKDEVRC